MPFQFPLQVLSIQKSLSIGMLTDNLAAFPVLITQAARGLQCLGCRVL